MTGAPQAPHRWAAGACAALACACTLLYYAADFHFAFNNDTLNFSHNRAQAMQAALRAGDLPLWNRLEGAGLDQWAEGSKDFLFAPLLLVLDAKSYLAIGGFASLAVAVFGFYWFAVNVGFGPWPAAAGAVIWAANGFALWHLHELNKQTVLALTPFVLGAVAILDRRPRLARLVLIGAAAAAVSYGRLDLLEYSYVTAALFALIWTPPRRRLAAMATLAVTGACGVLAAGWFAAPYAHALATSARLDRMEVPDYLPWDALLLHITPSVEGFVGSRSYVALIAIPLAAIGARLRHWDTRLAALLIAIYVLFAYDTGAYAWLQALPLHGATPNVVRFLVFFFFGLALLATRGLQALEPGGSDQVQRAHRVLAVTIVLAGAAAMTRWRASGSLDSAATVGVAQLLAWTVLLAVLVAAVARRWRVLQRATLVAMAIGTLAFGWAFDRLNANDGDLGQLEAAYFGRLDGTVASPATALLDAANHEPFRVLSYGGAHPTFWAAQGLESLTYYTPFPDRQLFLYVDAIAEEMRASPLARAGSVRFVCAAGGADVPRAWRFVVSASGMDCFERPDVLGRIRLVGNARVVPPGDAAIAAVSEVGAADPAWLETGVIVERELPSSIRVPVDVSGGRVRLLRRETNALEVAVSSGAGTILTIAERFAEGWRAEIDGAPAELFRANALYQAVAVPPGDHVVTLRYRTPYLELGLALTLLGVAASWWVLQRMA